MAAALCVMCGLCGGLAAWICTGIAGGKGSGAAPAPMVRLHALTHVTQRLFTRLAQAVETSRITERLLRFESFASAAEELASNTRLSQVKTQRQAAALLLGVCAFAVCAGGILSRSLAGCVVCAVGFCVFLSLKRSSRERAAHERLAREMPPLMRTLATALESGQTLVQAMDYVGLNTNGAASLACARVSLRLRCGMSADEALGLLGDELEAPGVGLMTAALAISQRTGSPLRDLLRRSAELVEQQGDLERMLSVKTAQVRLSVRVVCCLPPLMVCLLVLISPDYQEGLATAAGMGCLLVSALLDGLALIAIRRIMARVLK